MSGLFAELFKRLKWSKTNIDNVPFKMYSRVTVGIFMVASAVPVAKDYWGDPISCREEPDISEPFCWTHGAYHIDDPDIAASYSGGNCFRRSSQEDPEEYETKDTAYYVWVSLMLFIHGATFMIPNVLWKYLEGGWIAKLELTVDRGEKEAKEHAKDTAIALKKKS